MARLMLSAGMFSDFAARMAVRRRGFMSGSPPDLAAMAISLMRRVNILPRLASRAPFLCLMVAHLEWPLMVHACCAEVPRIAKRTTVVKRARRFKFAPVRSAGFLALVFWRLFLALDPGSSRHCHARACQK